MTEVMTPPPDTGTGFETTGIERVEEGNRAHTQLWDTMWLWWSANTVVATVAVGLINVFFGLGFWGSVLVIVIANCLGVLPVAFLSTLGPKTGLAQMPLTRFSFGLQGAKLPSVFNMIACVGWSAVNAIIGASLLITGVTLLVTGSGKQVAAGNFTIPLWLALIILAAITTLVSVFGYFIVHRYERYAWIPMIILFGYVFVAAAPHFDIGNFAAPALGNPLALFAGVVTFGGAVLGYAIGWSSYAADYTRRQPATTSSARVFWYAFLGVTLPCVVLEIVGVLLSTVSSAAGLVFNGALPGAVIANAVGTSTIASIVLLLLAFSTIANNVPNDYSFALSTQVLGLHVKRWILTIIGAVIYVIVAVLLAAKFESNLENFLLVIAYWLGSYSVIVLLEHWFRKGQYAVQDYETGSKLPVGIAAVVSMVVGLAVASLGVSQTLFTGPLAKLLTNDYMAKRFLNPADIGFPLVIIATGVVYFFLRRWELARYKR